VLRLSQQIAVGRSAFFGAFESGQWTPNPGDPERLVWLTVAGYAVATLLCLWLAVRNWNQRPGPAAGRMGLFWLAVSVVMLALAINKQLDIQMWVWRTGKRMARAYEIYEYRRAIQLTSFGVIVALATGLYGGYLWLLRGAIREHALALFGVLFTTCYVVIRASSMHKVDVFIRQPLGGVTLDVVLENGGIVLVATAALLGLVRHTMRRGPVTAAVEGSNPADGERPC